MDPAWKQFSVKTLENGAANAPVSYAVQLSEDVKDGVQNNTRLRLSPTPASGEIQIEGVITGYQVAPIAIQNQDEASKNRLTISANFTIAITAPVDKVGEMQVTSTRFADYNSDQDFSSIEAALISDINKQIVQDVINKLLSNW